MSDYRHLTPYKRPSDYGGATWHGWYAVYGQHRDSDALGRSNYRRILEDLEALDADALPCSYPAMVHSLPADPTQYEIDQVHEDWPEDSTTVCDTRVGHWAVGWAEIIYVHSSNVKACERADEILEALADYPVYDESDYSETEYNEAAEYWEHMSTNDRIEAIKRYACGEPISIFAARRDELPPLDIGSFITP